MKKRKNNKKMKEQKNQEILHKELDLIQGCINRMASNSFLIKGWFLTLFLGIITFGYEKISLKIIFLFLGIITLFSWISDTFFLQLERKYRKKYSWVIKNRYKNNNYLYNLNPNDKNMWDKCDNTKISFWEVFYSKTLLSLYGLILIALLVIVFYLQNYA